MAEPCGGGRPGRATRGGRPARSSWHHSVSSGSIGQGAAWRHGATTEARLRGRGARRERGGGAGCGRGAQARPRRGRPRGRAGARSTRRGGPRGEPRASASSASGSSSLRSALATTRSKRSPAPRRASERSVVATAGALAPRASRARTTARPSSSAWRSGSTHVACTEVPAAAPLVTPHVAAPRPAPTSRRRSARGGAHSGRQELARGRGGLGSGTSRANENPSLAAPALEERSRGLRRVVVRRRQRRRRAPEPRLRSRGVGCPWARARSSSRTGSSVVLERVGRGAGRVMAAQPCGWRGPPRQPGCAPGTPRSAGVLGSLPMRTSHVCPKCGHREILFVPPRRRSRRPGRRPPARAPRHALRLEGRGGWGPLQAYVLPGLRLHRSSSDAERRGPAPSTRSPARRS